MAPARTATLLDEAQRLYDPLRGASDRFGGAVALAGGRLLVSNSGGTGSAHLFDAATGAWLTSFAGMTKGAAFGASLDLDGNRVAIGAFREGTGNRGAVHLYDAATGNLLRSFINPGQGRYFGQSLALSGEVILIGSRFDGSAGENAGAAFLYSTRTGELLRRFINPGSGTNFGFAVDMEDAAVAIGRASGGAFLYDGISGALMATLADPLAGQGGGFGQSIATDGGRVLVGAPGAQTEAGATGAAHLFDSSGQLLATFDNPEGRTEDGFGTSLALEGDLVLIGAPGAGRGLGAAYLFEASGGLVETCPGEWGAELGTSLTLCRGQAAFGRPGCDENSGGFASIVDLPQAGAVPLSSRFDNLPAPPKLLRLS